jgi:hypothetical protein
MPVGEVCWQTCNPIFHLQVIIYFCVYKYEYIHRVNVGVYEVNCWQLCWICGLLGCYVV